MKKIVAFLALCLCLTACAKKIKPSPKPEKYNSDNSNANNKVPNGCDAGSENCELVNQELLKKGMQVYEEAIKDSVFKRITFEDVLTKNKNKEEFIAFYTFKECPWCQAVIPHLVSVAKKLNKTIHYVVVRDEKGQDLRTNDNDSYVKNVELLKDFVNDRISVPALVSFKDGKVLALHAGTVDGHNAKQREMTEKEVEKLEMHLTNLLSQKEVNNDK